MEPGLPRLLIVADLSDALTSLGGISLLELCGWGIASAAVHILGAFQIRSSILPN